jgi:hypothetical protein
LALLIYGGHLWQNEIQSECHSNTCIKWNNTYKYITDRHAITTHTALHVQLSGYTIQISFADWLCAH